MKEPNLFIIGEPKSGTTSLHYWLDQHPDVYMSDIKEPGYFQGNCYIEEYVKCFGKARDEIIIGESTANYIKNEDVAAKIKRYNDNAKIIAIFRDPVDQLISQYTHHQRMNREKYPTVKEAFKKSEYYQYNTKYATHILPFIQQFPIENIKIIIFDDLREFPLQTYREVCEFLDIDAECQPKVEVKNPKRVHRNKLIQNFCAANSFPQFRQFVLKYFPKRLVKIIQVLSDKVLFKQVSNDIPKYDRIHLKNMVKPEVEKLNKLLNENKLISPDTDLVKKWGYNEK